MATVVLYREVVRKSGRTRTGVRGPMLDLQADWMPLHVSVDGGRGVRLAATKAHEVEVEAGVHTVTASSSGTSPVSLSLLVPDTGSTIVAISPAWRPDITLDHPVGHWRLREVPDLSTVEPHAFYSQMPISVGGGVLRSVAFSLAASLLLTALGCFFLVPVALLGSDNVVAGVLAAVPCVPFAAFCLAIGVTGLVTGTRFLLLPADWRSPASKAA